MVDKTDWAIENIITGMAEYILGHNIAQYAILCKIKRMTYNYMHCFRLITRLKKQI